jgi:peptidoglycan/LPS O-acetylase OafA/YrhL
MEKHFSIYLDLVRFSAAILVVLSHFIQFGVVSEHTALFIPNLGREAVDIFFVLSGCVIAYTIVNKKQTIYEYCVARCARIYSVAVPALVVSFLLAYYIALTSGIANVNNYQVDRAYLYLPFHCLFLGEIWNISETPPWLNQYWSLDYEVWYYVLFAVIYYGGGYKRIILTVAILLLIGHKLLLLLPVWLSGVYLFHFIAKNGISKNWARLGWAATLVALAGYKYFNLDIFLRDLGNQIWPFLQLKLGSSDRYLADYFIGVLVFLNLFFAKNSQFISIEYFSGLIRSLASYTFTLYLIHGLVLSAWKYFYHYDPSSFLNIFSLSISIAIATYAMGAITERRKAMFEKIFRRGLNVIFIKRHTMP